MGGNREGRQTQLVFEPPVEKYGAFPRKLGLKVKRIKPPRNISQSENKATKRVRSRFLDVN